MADQDWNKVADDLDNPPDFIPEPKENQILSLETSAAGLCYCVYDIEEDEKGLYAQNIWSSSQ